VADHGSQLLAENPYQSVDIEACLQRGGELQKFSVVYVAGCGHGLGGTL